jgi:hypothetical protein
MVNDWLAHDPLLLIGGLVGMIAAAAVPRLRPIGLALAIGWLMMLRGGYVPFMHVIGLLPWSAVLVVAAVSTLPQVVRSQVVRAERVRPSRRPSVRTARATATVLAAVVLAVAGTMWPQRLAPMMTTAEPPTMRLAELWVANNVPRDKVVVVHDSIWVDLVHRYRFQPRPIIAQKLDADPAVRQAVHRLDYLVVPNWYYESAAAGNAYPTLLEARKHAVLVARFGSGPDGVDVYRVSRHWRP